MIRNPLLFTHPEFISIGNHVHIRNGARLEVVLDGSGRVPEMRIGDGTSMEQNCSLTCHCRLIIGKNVTIAPDCAIVEATHPYEVEEGHSICSAVDQAESFIEICDGAYIGTGCVILPNVRIGRYAIIGAKSVVRSDVPDYATAVGAPARVVKTRAPKHTLA